MDASAGRYVYLVGGMHDYIPLCRLCANILGMPRLGMPTFFFGHAHHLFWCVDMLAHTKPADMCV